MKSCSLLKVSAIAGALITLYGCNNDGMFTDTLSNIDHLQVRALNAPVGEFNAGDQVAVGYPLQYQATLYYNDGTPSADVTDEVVWATDNHTTTAIDADGVVEGLESGPANISATLEDLTSNTSPLTVTDETASALEISGRTATVNGIPVPFTATAVFSDDSRQDLTQFVDWSSSDTTIGDFTYTQKANVLVPTAVGITDIMAAYAPTELSSATPLTLTVRSQDDLDPDHPVYLTLNPTINTIAVGASQLYTVMVKLNTIDGVEPIAPYNITDFVEFESADDSAVTLSRATTTDGQGAVKATGLKVSSGVPITGSMTIQGTTYQRQGTLIVANDVVESIDVTCDDTTVMAGLDTQCTATGHYRELPDSDITDTVTWSSSNADVMTASSAGMMTGVTAGTANAVATSSTGVSGSAAITIDEASEIYSISITNEETSVNTGETLQMTAFAVTSDSNGEPTEEVTSRVSWTSTDAATTISKSGLLTAESGLTTDKDIIVTATAGVDVERATKPLTIIKTPLPYVCGTGVDDTDQSNATGTCLKIATDAEGNWFTSTPSIAVMEALGYKGPDEDATADSDTNSGDTYASTYTESGNYGPEGDVFARFRQDGIDNEGVQVVEPGDGDDVNVGKEGQFDRWCERLNELEFGGKTTWERPTEFELIAFYQKYEDAERGLWGARGWPTGSGYWSSTFYLSNYSYVYLYYAGVSNTPFNDNYASCVSKNP